MCALVCGLAVGPPLIVVGLAERRRVCRGRRLLLLVAGGGTLLFLLNQLNIYVLFDQATDLVRLISLYANNGSLHEIAAFKIQKERPVLAADFAR